MPSELQVGTETSRRGKDETRPTPKRDRRSRKTPGRYRMNVVEELFALDHPDEPPTMHLELRVAGSLDEGKLREAVAFAVATHPMTQARQVAGRFLLRP